MFTTFLIGLAIVVSIWMATLLPRRRQGVAPLRVPVGPMSVAAVATALVALGLWML